jgi:predicted amidohydrolase YtcJ
MRSLFGAVLMLLAAAAAAAPTAWINGRLYTLDQAQPWAEALVIEGDRISYVGDNAGALALVGEAGAVRDLGGRLVLPGFIDTHMHVGATLPNVFAVALSPEMSAQEVLDAIGEYAAKHPDREVIFGFGFLAAAFGELGPTAARLDAVVGDRSAFIVDEGGHTAWINSHAMEQVGLTSDTPDPVPGSHYFQRYPDGRPTGWLLESGAFGPIQDQLIVQTSESLQRAAAVFLPQMSSMGITAAFDAGFFHPLELEALEAMREAGRFPLRMVGSHYVNQPEQLPDAVATVQQLAERHDSELIQVRMLKLSLDGTVEARTAVLLEEYEGYPGHRGEPLIPARETAGVVADAMRIGMDLHIHALGDGAVRMGLDMVQAAREATPDSDTRVTLCHLQIVNPADIPRFGQLGVIAQSTPSWYVYDELALKYLGPGRFQHMYPLRSMAAGGARLTFGSDYPASWIGLDGLNPLFNIEMAITRRPAGDRDYPVQDPAGEVVTLEQAIRAYTVDAAYQLRMEDQVGSITAGRQADLVVLSDNLFEMDPYDIHTARVLLTVMNGEQQFNALD